MTWVVIALLLVAITASPALAQLDQLLRGLPKTTGDGLSDAKIGEGLKQALQVGTEHAVQLTGRTDGYFRNEAIKIRTPESIRSVERALRAMGQGAHFDEFVLSMNRAAERAAPAAKAIFWDAIGAMSIEDARRILQGSDTAATEYFKDRVGGKLAAAFAPTVSQAMDEVGTTRQYKILMVRAKTLPFAPDLAAFDLDRYVVGKALDGLFLMVGQEERKIRRNPVARSTELLKDVFGRP